MIAFKTSWYKHAGMKAPVTLTLTIAILLSGCITQANQQVEAGAMVDQLYASIENKDWDTALSLYGKRFYAQMSKQEWKETLQTLRLEMGHIKSRTVNFTQRDAKYRYDAYIFSFNVQYEKGKTRDLITIYKAVDGKGLHIVAHRIDRIKTSSLLVHPERFEPPTLRFVVSSRRVL